MILLTIAKPSDQEASLMEKMTHMLAVTKDLEGRASEICALALSSESEAVWVNSFGPIAFCAPKPLPSFTLFSLIADRWMFSARSGEFKYGN